MLVKVEDCRSLKPPLFLRCHSHGRCCELPAPLVPRDTWQQRAVQQLMNQPELGRGPEVLTPCFVPSQRTMNLELKSLQNEEERWNPDPSALNGNSACEPGFQSNIHPAAQDWRCC